MRPAITVTNTDRRGRVLDDNKWFVRVGSHSRLFNEEDWKRDGLSWINSKIVGA